MNFGSKQYLETSIANEINVDNPSSLSDAEIHAWIDGAVAVAA